MGMTRCTFFVMPRWTAAAILSPTKISAASSCCLFLLWFGRGCAFSLPARGKNNNDEGFFQHVLVQHTDQLQQQQRQRLYHDHEHGGGGDDDGGPSALVPPPHLFCIPAPGGDVCLVVDEKGDYHAVRDACPPLGVPVSQTAVVDSQVDAIGDSLFGTRFSLKDGAVRGLWCPGGGTAGPLLLRLARHRRHPRLARLLVNTSRRISWMTHHISPSSSFRRRTTRKPLLFGRLPPLNFDENATTTGLEVLAVTERPDGGLTVALPLSPLRTATGNKADSDCSADDEGLATTTAAAAAVAVVMQQAKCDLAGYDY